MPLSSAQTGPGAPAPRPDDSGGPVGSVTPARPALLAVALCLCALLLALFGCAQPPRPHAQPCLPTDRAPAAEVQPRDIVDIPQNVGGLLAQAPAGLDAPLLAPAAQAAFLARFRTAHFAPWAQDNATFSRAGAFWGLDKLTGDRHFGENLLPLGPGFRAEMDALCQAGSYPSMARPAIATANTSLRVLPTIRPGFLKPTRPGEGFPFDYWQNSGLWAGTPLMVTHLSADGAWALVEARNAGGWVRVADIAYVDELFMGRWTSLPLLAITRERVPVSGCQSGRDGFLFHGRIGAVLPLVAEDEHGYTALAPARSSCGLADVVTVRIRKSDAAPMPLAATPRVLAGLADQMLGQPYGWGGYLDNRDCSALMVDLFAPFGIYMPRNSAQQARAGEFTSLKGLSGPEKEALVLAQGVPLLTLLHKPGHIMLYLGRLPANGGANGGPNGGGNGGANGDLGGRAAMLHAIWGLKSLDEAGVEGRVVLGRTVVTSLDPGRELPDVARSGTLLDTMTGMTLLAPGGNPPASPDRTR